MSELISKEKLLTTSRDYTAYQEMVEELNTLLLKGAGKPIQYDVKYPDLIELLVNDLVEKGYDVYYSGSISVLLIT